MLKEFKTFVLRGNVIDLAVAFVVGGAFATLVKALVVDMFTPLLSIGGHHSFEQLQFEVGHSVFRYGDFLNDVVAFVVVAAALFFVVVAAALFFVVVRPAEALTTRAAARRGAVADTKSCPECLSSIPYLARRCAFCAAEQPPIAS